MAGAVMLGIARTVIQRRAVEQPGLVAAVRQMGLEQASGVSVYLAAGDRLQATFNPLDAGDLDVLRAFELLENRAGLLETMIRLAQPSRVRRDAGRAIGPMRLLNISEKGRYAYLRFAIPRECEETDLSAGAFGLIVSDGEPDFILEPRFWSSLGCDLQPPWPNDGPSIISVRVFRGNFNGSTFQEMKRRAGPDGWWLDQSFVDLNSSKADAFLSFLGAQAIP